MKNDDEDDHDDVCCVCVCVWFEPCGTIVRAPVSTTWDNFTGFGDLFVVVDPEPRRVIRAWLVGPDVESGASVAGGSGCRVRM